MSSVPADLRYTKEHEWVRRLEDGILLVGVTDFAQESLGDVTFVELPEVGDSFEAGDTFGVVESVKAASDLYMPIAGEVTEINPDLDEEPELVNQSPYEKAWMLKLKPASESAWEELLTADAYQELL